MHGSNHTAAIASQAHYLLQNKNYGKFEIFFVGKNKQK
jgi:hypothetical protein